jgi:hypothetical protein
MSASAVAGPFVGERPRTPPESPSLGAASRCRQAARLTTRYWTQRWLPSSEHFSPTRIAEPGPLRNVTLQPVASQGRYLRAVDVHAEAVATP